MSVSDEKDGPVSGVRNIRFMGPTIDVPLCQTSCPDACAEDDLFPLMHFWSFLQMNMYPKMYQSNYNYND